MEKPKIGPRSKIKQLAMAAQEKAEDIGEIAKDTASKVKGDASEFVGEAARKAAMEIYKPVFPEDQSEQKMIIIADEDDRKDIEVCRGSIGWASRAGGMYVLHLYEEAVPISGIEFFPQPQLYSVYYQDAIDGKRYISLDRYFDTIQKDKITELKRIAYDLGAKSCRLESYEEEKSVRIAKAKAGLMSKGKKAKKGAEGQKAEDGEKAEEGNLSAGASAGVKSDAHSHKSVVFSQTFEGNDQPRRPELKWFANDKEIEFLIDTRCGGSDVGKTKEYSMELSSTSMQTMNVQAAAKIDKALSKLGASFNFSLEGEALTEQRRRLLFEIEF